MAARVTPQEIVEMQRLYAELGTFAAVGRKMGRSGSTVARYVQLKSTPHIVRHIYIGHVRQMKEFEEKAKKRGIKAISIWSVNNQDHPMTEEQRRVRDYILTNAALPPEYDMFIVNASSETSINIFGDLDYIVIHNQEEETQIQVRGRYRDDLDSLYVLNYDCVPYVPAEFMGVKLFTEDKKRLCEALSLRQDDGKKKAWPSTKEALIEDGYTITEGRQNCKRFAIITR